MAKIPEQYQFFDLSDYGRYVARKIALALKNTTVTPIQITSCFIISGLLGLFCILNEYNYAAAFFLILKSILDAADGELSRVKKMPSYVGRYYDSIADIVLNFLFLLMFWYIGEASFVWMIFAFVGLQLQGTLYNYYYVILRNQVAGDTTSRIFENKPPRAMPGEQQETVDLFFKIFNFFYFAFDKTIYYLDREAIHSPPFPKWFMTAVSSLGLGFQLLLMSAFLVAGRQELVIPFFIGYSMLILCFIGIRRWVLI